MVDALLAVAATSPEATPAPASPVVDVPFVFAPPAPHAVEEPDPPRRPAKKQKRETMPPEYVKPPGKPGKLHPHWRKSFPDDEEDADGRGKIVDVPDALRLYGVWRRVPGFWRILASDEGFITTEGVWAVRTPTVGLGRYLSVGCTCGNERVHTLVCRAFKGRPTAEQVSVDHGDRDESNNCAVNLKWATTAEQRRNQGEAKTKSNGEPCLVWQVKGDRISRRKIPYDTTRVENTEQRFPSKWAAATALGLEPGNVGLVLNGKRRTAVSTEGKRYTGKWDPDLADLEGEAWKEAGFSTRSRLFVSNYGRIQCIYPGGRKGTKHYPESSNAKDYLVAQIDGQRKCVHVLVGELFFIGPKPRNWAVWDHKDLDKQNNHIGNLRPVTFEENATNTARQRDFYLWPVDDPDQWVRCVSQSATARAYNLHSGNLRSVLHKRPDKYGSIRKTVHGYRAAFCDEVD